LVVWRVLYWWITGSFEATHFTEIMAWRNYYAPDYADVFGRASKVVGPYNTSKGKKKKKKEEGKSEKEEQKAGDVVNQPPFNLSCTYTSCQDNIVLTGESA
jgi:hypothetical protein